MKLLYLLLLSFAAQAQVPLAGRPAASFMPAGYEELDGGRATGDLNRDGRPDLALVVGAKNEAQDTTEAGPPPRRLLVLLAVPGGGYRLAAASSQAVLCRGCGGVYGDPFAGIDIQKGVLTLDHYGGSNWRWNITGKFRWQQDGFYLIGRTHQQSWIVGDECPGPAGFRAGDELLDENLLTGAFEARRVSRDCQVLENRKGRRTVRPLQALAAYKPAP